MWGNRSGSEPRTARSALGMRAVLSGVALPVALAATALFVFLGVSTGLGIWFVEAVVTGVVVVIAAVDLVVIRRRARRSPSGERATRSR
ncbi:hypothetical protein DQ384_01230 [Sphaerisporangium album]|uniref:Uncharacterized protein n=1 Tax=Sphaerisporangium album TaxID=509200 RepID=A0A367FSJ0_9ACTN|nr:DUF6343 family protein [Sphaerisporangium album]RCG33368.1 hypothetical protein DQ384_01230 [Sphaerisporangium album]